DVQANLQDVISKINQGREKGADLIVFPELALTGYFVGPRYHEVALRMDSDEVRQIALATRGTAAVIGFIEESPSMNFYNSALVAVDGEIFFAYRKLNLPNYGVFEERKIFSHGKHVPVFKLKDFNIALFICNDLWHPSVPYLGISQKADIFISIFNSSQGSMGDEFSNIESWSIINRFYSRIFGVYNICVNRVGEEHFKEKRALAVFERNSKEDAESDDPTSGSKKYRFWGGSEILNPFGKNIAKAELYEPDEIFAEIQRDIVRKKRILLPYLRNDDPHFTYRELQRILYEKRPTES
ncbi:MAG: nitrilase, partial [Deltaproteobacteria bacterium]|nr:nitrilase [Deltaproteobacteria bacterium]